MVQLKLEFSGGCELVVGKKKFHEVQVPSSDSSIKMRDLIKWMKENLIDDKKSDQLVHGETVRSGILVLINDSDWEIFDGLETPLKDGDTITFLSTIHGG